MILEAVYNLLAGSHVITEVGGQLHYEHRPQGQTGSAIVLQRGSTTTDQHFGGPSDFHTGFFRVNILASQYLRCSDLALMVREQLNGYHGEAITTEGHPLLIAFITLEEESDIPNVLAEGQSQPRMYGIAADYRFGHHALPYVASDPE